jgi:hypothetical protein
MKPSAAQDSQIEGARQDLPAKDSKQKWDDPEGSYRRGFEHGAHLTFESAKHLFDTEAGRERLRQWVEVELRQWRLATRETRTPTPPEQ